MVVVSDDEARGFMFAYDKLFAMKAKSKADIGPIPAIRIQ